MAFKVAVRVVTEEMGVMGPREVTLDCGEAVAMAVVESTLTLMFMALTLAFGLASELEFRFGFGFAFGWCTLVALGTGYP